MASRRIVARRFALRRLVPLVAFLLTAAPAAQAASSTPATQQIGGSTAITVAPGSGVAGTPLTIGGSGWTAGDPVDIQINGQQVCNLIAAGTGACRAPTPTTAVRFLPAHRQAPTR